MCTRRTLWALGLLLVLPVGACRHRERAAEQSADAGPKAVRFAKVPLQVEVPRDWKQTHNTAQWLVFRPARDGAMVAMSGEKSCAIVERRLYSAMLELGLTDVVWDGTASTTTLNGLRANLAQGTARESDQPSFVKYSLTRARDNRGCLVTLASVWKSKDREHRDVVEQILASVRAQD